MVKRFYNIKIFKNKIPFFKVNKFLRIIIKKIIIPIGSFINAYKSREVYNFNNINSEKKNIFIKVVSSLNYYIYKKFEKADLNYLSYYFFILEKYIFKLLIFQKKYDDAINYGNKLFFKYPNFSASLSKIYIFILKKHTYKEKKNIEYFLKLKGIKKGIIYIIDSHSSKVPISLYYSALNKFKSIKILGVHLNKNNLFKIKDISNEYDTIDLHLNSLFQKNKFLEKKIFEHLKNLKSKGFKINLWINEYHHFKNYKKFNILLNLINNYFVLNEEIKRNLVKYKKIDGALIKVINIINYNGLLNSYKTKIYNKNKLLDQSFKYTLHITSLKDLDSYKFAKELIVKNKESQLFSNKNKLIIILNLENINRFKNKQRENILLDLVKNEKNILIIKEEYFGWYGKNYYFSLFKNIENLIIFDNNIFYHEYFVLANTLKFNIFYKINFSEDLYSYTSKYLFKNYHDLSLKLQTNKKIIDQPSNNLSFYEIECSNNILQEPALSNKKHNLIESKNIFYKYQLIVVRIIGNNLPPLHNPDQSLVNMKFIIENEKLPYSSKRIWVINRIINSEVRKSIVNLLDQYKEQYKIINYESKQINNIAFEDFQHSKNIFNREVSYYLKSKNKFFNKILFNFNKYIMNNNGARNFALKIGKQEKAKWTLPLDGNIFIPSAGYKKIEDDIQESNFNYLIMPMARIDSYEEINNPNKLNFCEEPQIGFSYESTLNFNENYVYGSRPKVELLQKLQVLDRWGSIRSQISDNIEDLNINFNHYFDYKYSGGIIRLPSVNNSQEFSPEQLLQKRAFNRDKAIFYTIRDNILKEYKSSCNLSLSIYNLKNIHLISSKFIDEIKKPFVSVCDKPFPEEIINFHSKHDYLSFAPYWWPDKLKDNGLPYIWRDGEWNPECILHSKESKNNDRTSLQILFNRITSLSLLYMKKKDEKIINYIAKQIFYWFINEQTKMNPNLKFAQFIRGKQKQNEKGLIDFKDIYYFLSAIKLIEEDLYKIKSFDFLNFKYWLIEYYSWLTNSDIGRKEACSLNNHTTCYLLQKASIESFMGMEKKLFETFICTFVFINNNISENGEQMEELKRTTSKHYCCFNIQQILNLNSIFINSLNMNLFNFYGNKENKLLKSIIWLYKRKDKWDYQQINHFEKERLDVLFHIARKQSKKVSELIHEKELKSIDEISCNFDYKYGIPLHWKI